jgi:hypothetical protein
MVKNTQYTWEGNIGWEKVEEKKTQERGAAPTAINNGVITLNFPPLPNLPSWEEELQREWVPDIVGRLIWGYRVKLNGDFVGDWPAFIRQPEPILTLFLTLKAFLLPI